MNTEAEGLSDEAAILAGIEPDSEPQETDEPEPSQEHEDVPSAKADEEPESSADGEEAQEAAEPLTIKSLAEKLETSPAKLYNDLQIDIDGEKVSLGALKDHGKDLLNSKVLLAQAEEKADQTNMQISDRAQELQLLAQELGIQPTEQQLAAQREKINAYTESENKLLKTYIDDFDNDKFQEWLTRQGYTPDERRNMLSAKLRRDLYQSMQREERINRAFETEEKVKQQPPKRHTKAEKGAAAKAVEAFKQGKASQEAAVTALIAEGMK